MHGNGAEFVALGAHLCLVPGDGSGGNHVGFVFSTEGCVVAQDSGVGFQRFVAHIVGAKVGQIEFRGLIEIKHRHLMERMEKFAGEEEE